MPTETYHALWHAMRARQLASFTYNGLPRTACPVILGYGGAGEEKIFVYQIAGRTSGNERLPNWKCLTLAKVRELTISKGEWREGASHQQTQSCIKFVDIDVNIPKTLRHKAPLPFGSPKLMAPRVPEIA